MRLKADVTHNGTVLAPSLTHANERPMITLTDWWSRSDFWDEVVRYD